MVWPGGCVADLKIYVQRGFVQTGYCGDNDPYSAWVTAYSYDNKGKMEPGWNATTHRAPVDVPLDVWTANKWASPVWNEELELKCLRSRTQPLYLGLGPFKNFGACFTFDPVNWAERASRLPRDGEPYGLYNFNGVDVDRGLANVSVLLLALYYPDTAARDWALLGSSLGLGLLLLAGCCWWRLGRPRCCQKRRPALLDPAAAATSPASEASPAATTPPPPPPPSLPAVPNPLPMARGDGGTGDGGRQHHHHAATRTTMAAAPPAPPARRAPSWRTLPAEAPSWGPPRAARPPLPPPPPPPPQQEPEEIGVAVCEAVPVAEAVAAFGTSYRGPYAEVRVLHGAAAEDGGKGRQG